MRMKTMMMAMLLVSLLSGCGGNDSGSVSREFFANSELLVTNTSITRTSGDKLVFRYELEYPEDSKVANDELSEVFWFEVPADRVSFDFSLEGGATIPVGYERICACDQETYVFNDGFISGGKVNEGEWKIAFQFTAQDSENRIYPLHDEGTYKLSN